MGDLVFCDRGHKKASVREYFALWQRLSLAGVTALDCAYQIEDPAWLGESL